MAGKRWKRTTNILGNILLVFMTAAALLLAVVILQSRLTGREPALAGYRPYIVMSGSMEPALPVGGLVVVRPLAAEKIQRGDIITYRSGENSLTTHRVDRLETDGGRRFITKGDANNAPDPAPVQPSQVVGKVALTVPYLGYLLYYIRTREGLTALLALAVLIIAAGLVRKQTLSRKEPDSIPNPVKGARAHSKPQTDGVQSGRE